MRGTVERYYYWEGGCFRYSSKEKNREWKSGEGDRKRRKREKLEEIIKKRRSEKKAKCSMANGCKRQDKVSNDSQTRGKNKIPSPTVR